ncbi:MAG: HlyD family efflux transporter periplasmic adaptor subunit, partial [Pyrinomonadaceae bacterium]|nr:HlyD family efflux transporter periplasmic adaptor subunit [Sphingobacteriaceae bacterium]
MFLDSKTQTDKLIGFESFNKVITKSPARRIKRTFFIGLLILTALMFLPWTQNIQSAGTVSTLQPNQRPQQINTIIAGKILKWHIRDGQIVNKGDTILELTEVKEEYLDSSLLDRVDDQIQAKGASVQYYRQKAGTTEQQERALASALQFKISQLKNKLWQYRLQVQSDSISYVAAQNQLKISNDQLKRQKELYDAGLKSLTELEQRQQYFQDANAKRTVAENKYYNSKNELINIRLELSGVEQEYAEKISKTSGDRFTALSQVYTTEGEIAKLKNQFANYSQRRKFYVITAPQKGQVVRTVKAGIGEIVKEGEQLLQIVPTEFSPAVEMQISAVDMPLVQKNQRVRLQFDGFPAIVFSGWPQASYGTFAGTVSAIDPSVNSSGKFKIWVVPEGKKPWPSQLRFGGGAEGIALLNDVPIIYELWRQLNGFPAEYYKSNS